MLFNSLSFAIFLSIVFILYWFIAKKDLRLQNILLMVSSCFFYAYWDWRFLFLLLFSIAFDYWAGIKIFEANGKNRKIWLWSTIAVNLGILFVFKYYNFFTSSFIDALHLMGLQANLWSIKLILPLGISFFTFHGLSYVIDLYNNKIKPEKNIIVYSVFVSYFPLLVAGPIERATHLLPQLLKKREFDYKKAVDGLRQILWGLFKKIVIADNCAKYANLIFNDSVDYSGSTLVLGALFFSVQIYCDFSGYSDIAIGTSRLFGIELLRNFAFPYFSRDIAEFWRRWHISLTTWFRDYLYIPLGGSHGNSWMKIRNTFVIFIVSGFWHGANWTFIVWGLLNAIYFLPLLLNNTNRNNLVIVAEGKSLPSLKELTSMLLTFGLTVLAWIFFRSENIIQALNYVSGIFSSSFFAIPQFPQRADALITIILAAIFFLIEWFGREQQYALADIGTKRGKATRWFIYLTIGLLIFWFRGENQEFIYFQF